MSQEKVDKYKQEKANRKKTIAKEKRKKKMYRQASSLMQKTKNVAIYINRYFSRSKK